MLRVFFGLNGLNEMEFLDTFLDNSTINFSFKHIISTGSRKKGQYILPSEEPTYFSHHTWLMCMHEKNKRNVFTKTNTNMI